MLGQYGSDLGCPGKKKTVDTSFDYTYPSHILRISLVRILNHIISIHIPHPKHIQTSWGHHKQMAVSILFFQVQASRCALPSLTCLKIRLWQSLWVEIKNLANMDDEHRLNWDNTSIHLWVKIKIHLWVVMGQHGCWTLIENTQSMSILYESCWSRKVSHFWVAILSFFKFSHERKPCRCRIFVASNALDSAWKIGGMQWDAAGNFILW